MYSESVKFSKFFAYLNLVNLLLFSFFSLCVYSLYTVDILIGIISAHYAIRLAKYLHPVFDEKFFGAEASSEADYFEILFAFLNVKCGIDSSESSEKQKITEQSLKEGKEPTARSNKANDSLNIKTSNQNREKEIVYNDECDMI